MVFVSMPGGLDATAPGLESSQLSGRLHICPRRLPARPQRLQQSRGGLALSIRAQAKNEDQQLSLAAAKPKSPVGDMLAYYLKAQPHLFKDAIAEQLTRLKEQRDAEAQQSQEANKDSKKPKAADKSEMTLYRRMHDLRKSEQQATLEDLMYASVLEKFLELELQMLPRMDSVLDTPTNLKALTEGLHSKDALEHVREHVRSCLGPAAGAFSNTMLKMSKLQGAQVYAQSIMFGYFIRRVDKRFQLEKSIGSLMDQESVNRLERLFNAADQMQEGNDPDAPSASSSSGESTRTVMDLTSDAESRPAPSNPITEDGIGGRDIIPAAPKKASRLREYIEKFDQSTLLEMSRMLSQESVAIVETQTSALFGDIRKLQEQMQNAVGQDISSYEELMNRVQQLVSDGSVESLVISVGTQRRAVLEAVAFGTFLRDVEEHVGDEYSLLTPARVPPYGRGEGGGGGGGGRPVPQGPSPLAGV
ncbi:hypothetical protein WJX74_003735 [Apatococcus lobatus]|uniref:Uncharacterized protein n=2 Tax=Apatococcus TaxID=904362 RepID=A0AAW1T5F7_9CHLO